MATRVDVPSVHRVDPYTVLGVPEDATIDEIARAYRNGAKSLHPDVTAADAAAFHALVLAYRTLRDPVTRRAYDDRRRRRPDPGRRPADRPPPRPVRLSRRQATAAIWAGVTCAALGIAVGVLTAVLVADGAAFRDGSVGVTATVVEAPDGSTAVEFTTESGAVVRAPEPDAANPGVRGDEVAVRYDRDDPTRVRADQSTAARDLTLALVALKLVVAGPVFAVVGARARARAAAAVGDRPVR